jgi:hypothetical protein
MATYSSEDYERIAAAISQNVADILEHKHLFEWAADTDWIAAFPAAHRADRDVCLPPKCTTNCKGLPKMLVD